MTTVGKFDLSKFNSFMSERQSDTSANIRDARFRTPEQHDYARIIHSSAFKRLQNKTQVYGVGNSDKYRTRLTHSLEVAQIGESIVDYLHMQRGKIFAEIKPFLPSSYQIRAICLAHDIGNPPFGHAAEAVLNKYMKTHGGFEGNGQTLRILSNMPSEYDFKCGFDVTRRTLLGVLKYPVPFSGLINKSNSTDENTPPKCYMDSESDVVQWILKPFNSNDIKLFQTIKTDEQGISKPKFKALDTSIMELADDIAYTVYDLEDAIKMGLLTLEEIKDQLYFYFDKGFTTRYIHKMGWKTNDTIQKEFFANLIFDFVSNIELNITNSDFSHEIFKYNVSMHQKQHDMLVSLKRLTRSKAVNNFQVQRLEYRGQMIIDELFGTFIKDDNSKLLPLMERTWYKQADDEHTRYRVICDYIAGMSDVYASNVYQLLFIPNEGKMFEHI